MPSTVSGSPIGGTTVTVTAVVTLPTWVFAGQVSAFSWATVQKGVAVGSPTIPGGRWIVRFLTSVPVSGKATWRVKLLCAPASVAAGWATRPLTLKAACAVAGTIAIAASTVVATTAALSRFRIREMTSMSSTALPVIIILGMPIYEYRCPDGHRFEVFQSMADDPVSKCEVCGKPVERVFHPIAVHFKGSGFYTTDYARKGASKGVL